MADYPIRIQVSSINGDRKLCKGRAHTPSTQDLIFHITTPEGLCARALHTMYPYIMAMRFSEKTFFERGGEHIDIACPDGDVVFRLTRVRETSQGQ